MWLCFRKVAVGVILDLPKNAKSNTSGHGSPWLENQLQQVAVINCYCQILRDTAHGDVQKNKAQDENQFREERHIVLHGTDFHLELCLLLPFPSKWMSIYADVK